MIINLFDQYRIVTIICDSDSYELDLLNEITHTAWWILSGTTVHLIFKIVIPKIIINNRQSK